MFWNIFLERCFVLINKLQEAEKSEKQERNKVNLTNYPSGEEGGFDELSTDNKAVNGIKYNMRKNLDLDHEGCYLQTGKKECLEECGFNATAKTIFIIHGWTVS